MLDCLEVKSYASVSYNVPAIHVDESSSAHYVVGSLKSSITWKRYIEKIDSK